VLKLFELAKIFFKDQIIYRFDVSISAVETVGRLLFAWLIWGAVFAGRDVVGGFTFEVMLLYYLVSSFIATLNGTMLGVSGEISHEIRNGNFTKFMVIPLNPQLYWLSQNFGVVTYLAMFILPVSVIGGFVFGTGGFVFQPALFLGLLMIPVGLAFMVSFHFFIGILAFKFQEVGFFLHIQHEVVNFVQGGVVPLVLLPAAALDVIRLLPFPHVVFTPAMLIIGQMDLREGFVSLGILVFWLAAFTVIAQVTYHRLRVKYDGVGI